MGHPREVLKTPGVGFFQISNQSVKQTSVPPAHDGQRLSAHHGQSVSPSDRPTLSGGRLCIGCIVAASQPGASVLKTAVKGLEFKSERFKTLNKTCNAATRLVAIIPSMSILPRGSGLQKRVDEIGCASRQPGVRDRPYQPEAAAECICKLPRTGVPPPENLPDTASYCQSN